MIMAKFTKASRRSFFVLAGALAVLAACGKKRDESRTGKLARSLGVLAAAPTDALSGGPAALPLERLPAWVREKPHYFSRDGRRFASAVGSARVDNLALARGAATDRARADLLRFIKGGAAGDAITGVLTGSRVTDAFTSKIQGEVFVRVEVEESPEQ